MDVAGDRPPLLFLGMNQPAEQRASVLVDLLQGLERLAQGGFGAAALGHIDGHHDGAGRVAGRVPERCQAE